MSNSGAMADKHYASEFLAARESRVDVMPEADVGLALDPAEVDLVVVAQRGEVDQAAVEVAQLDLAPLELPGAGLAARGTPRRPAVPGRPPPLPGAASDSASRASASVRRERAARIATRRSETHGSSARASWSV